MYHLSLSPEYYRCDIAPSKPLVLAFTISHQNITLYSPWPPQPPSDLTDVTAYSLKPHEMKFQDIGFSKYDLQARTIQIQMPSSWQLDLSLGWPPLSDLEGYGTDALIATSLCIP